MFMVKKMNNITKSNQVGIEDSHLREVEVLIIAVGPETRAYYSLERILKKIIIKKCILVVFKDLQREKGKIPFETNLDKKAKEIWMWCYQKMTNILQDYRVNTIIIDKYYSEQIMEVINEIKKNIAFSENKLLDMSCFPKGYILELLRWLGYQKIIPLYTEGIRHNIHEEEFAVGVKQIITLSGFEGIIKNREDLLVLILGFEGYRAEALLHYFQPSKALGLIGNPNNEKSLDYICVARKNNSNLLGHTMVVEKQISSLNYDIFSHQLDDIINQILEQGKIENKEYDIYVSPLGTKIQTLGLFKYWLDHKEIQIVYAIPSKRRTGVIDVGPTWICPLQNGVE